MTKCVKRIRDLFEYALYKFTLYLLCFYLLTRIAGGEKVISIIILYTVNANINTLYYRPKT